MSKLSGAQILIECWKKEGVEVVFGYPGAATVEIHHHLEESPIRFVLCRHEQAAVHAADGYARSTGRPGVVLVTSGPGATNTVTGLAGANMDSVPVVVFSGQVARMLIGNDAFQEVDIVGMTRPATKHNYLVLSTEELAQTVKEAFYVAVSGRPGSILVDLPKDVIGGEAEFSYPKKVTLRAYRPHLTPHPRQVRKAADLLLSAKRPVVLAGGGVTSSGASEELLSLAERLAIPVATTLMGLGGFPGSHPLCLGMPGMHGLYRANMALQNADLILAVGARFDDRVTGALPGFARQATIVHIDVDTTSIHKILDVDIPLVADARQALAALSAELGEAPAHDSDARAAWLDRIEAWNRQAPLAYVQDADGPLKPQYVIEALYRETSGKAVICTEVGQHQMWAAQFYPCERPRQFISSGGLGVMGFGLPAAIGAQVASPGATVVDVAGDGSILMNIQELATVFQESLPIKVAVINNGSLGMVRQWQDLFYGRRHAATVLSSSPDFVLLAEAFGIRGFSAASPAEADRVIGEALAHPGPALMDFKVSPDELVFPMVPAGEALDKMLLAFPETGADCGPASDAPEGSAVPECPESPEGSEGSKGRKADGGPGA
ncbi:MAG: biosynthetic-type acetolactate synthase large subunit [Deltaproteobacteria bacterium]|jgi:acetolactate synthase-1/2/3 large subunit|nr:biosynthetic-type acetolactate synthase large subunit [Deltaproteobacteria bacterium]